MKKSLFAIALVLAAGTLVLIEAAARQPAPRDGKLTIEQLIDIRHPSSPVWSPDGRHVAFLSERAGIANIFVADVTSSSAAPVGAVAYWRAMAARGGVGGPGRAGGVSPLMLTESGRAGA